MEGKYLFFVNSNNFVCFGEEIKLISRLSS